jgi:hypothetical protein
MKAVWQHLAGAPNAMRFLWCGIVTDQIVYDLSAAHGNRCCQQAASRANKLANFVRPSPMSSLDAFNAFDALPEIEREVLFIASPQPNRVETRYLF